MCKNCQKWLSHFIKVIICVAKTLSEERLGHKLLFQNSQKANKTVPTDQQRDTLDGSKKIQQICTNIGNKLKTV